LNSGHAGRIISGMARPGRAKNGDYLTGKLLIAMPGIGDPRFDRTVIFMCAHNENSAMGLIVNRPAPGIDFRELLQQLDIETADAAQTPRILIGGPVERSRGFVLHSADYRLPKATLSVTPEIGMTASIDILRAFATGDGPRKAVLALGYSGWGAGQLESEIRANGWLTGDPDESILFGSEDDAKWSSALGRLGIDPRMLSAAGGQA
jgi:putative transcriptional regulator